MGCCFPLCTKLAIPQIGWQLGECAGMLSNLGLLSVGETAAEEADSEDHVMFP